MIGVGREFVSELRLAERQSRTDRSIRVKSASSMLLTSQRPLPQIQSTTIAVPCTNARGHREGKMLQGVVRRPMRMPVSLLHGWRRKGSLALRPCVSHLPAQARLSLRSSSLEQRDGLCPLWSDFVCPVVS